MRIKAFLRSIHGVVILAIVASGLVTAVIGHITFETVHHELERQLDHRIELETDDLVGAYAEGGLPELINEVNKREKRVVPGRVGYLVGVSNESRAMGFLIRDARGRTVAGHLKAGPAEPGWSEFLEIRRADGSAGFAQAMNTALPDGNRLIVSADRAVLEEMGFRLRAVFYAGIGLILLVCAATAFGLERFVQNRLGKVQNTAEAIMAGEMHRRIPLDNSGSEFDKLSQVLNRMLDRISSLLSNLKQVSENIAHDMRTPLHRLRYQLEAAEREEKDPVQRQRLQAGLAEADELLDLFTSLLAISEIEGEALRGRFGAVDLSTAVREIIDAYAPTFKEANLEVIPALAQVEVFGDKRLLQQCVANLFDNVLSHANTASKVQISLAVTDRDAVLRVSDNGSGISESDRQRIFERFVRLERARSGPGHGLGLSLVAAIAAAHHGSVSAAPLQPGLAIEIVLPVAAR